MKIFFFKKDNQKSSWFLSKEIKILLVFTLILNLTSLLTFCFIFKITSKTLFSQLASENLQLKVLTEELKKELSQYKQSRNINDTKLLRQMIALRSDLNNVLNQTKVLGSSSPATLSANLSNNPLGILRIPDSRFEEIALFAEPRASSKIVGEITSDNPLTIYFFTQKTPGWFKIEYKEGRFGWIQEQFVEELYD